MQDENIDLINEQDDEKEIDLLELATTLWHNRKKLITWSICGAVIGLVVAFSIPKEYSTSVTLSPEITDPKASAGGLSGLASMVGLNVGSMGGVDAVYPQLYPDVVSSVPFVTSLFDVEVETDEEGRKTTVREFMEEDTKSPWWGVILGAPGKLIGMLKTQDEVPADHKLDNFRLTTDENLLVEALNERISASVDQKTNVVTIGVKMQDPLVSAILADTVVRRLQQYITDYRTNKARNDLDYALKINDEAKAEYYKAQQKYADYLDRNQGLAFHGAQTMRERLANEASLAFNLYQTTAQQVQHAQAKVQENTPAYVVVTPATVPVKPTSPRKVMILIGFTFLAFMACAGWVLYLKPFVEEQKKKSSEEVSVK